MEVTREHLKNHGRPCSYYADRHSIFVHTATAGENENKGELTQLGRALKTLDIELINALTPQAKGRVERANKTLQDRLVKELRLKGISDIATANAYLPEFMQIYNAKFAKPAKDDRDAHRPVLHSEQELELIFHVTRSARYRTHWRFVITTRCCKSINTGIASRVLK
jgi:hypothetical protein